MLYILFSITCNILVSIFLKLAKRYEVDVRQAVMWNYSIAAVLTWLFLKPQLTDLQLQNTPWAVYISLGILLPALFVVIALCIRHTGIVRTDVAQRLSLLIPIFASFIIFQEELSPLKITGIAVGFAAIICSIPWNSSESTAADSYGWIYLLIVFIGMGFIDVLFKQIAGSGVPFSTSLLFIYSLAFILSLGGIFILSAAKKLQFSWKYLIPGWILGITNFGNILFYLKAHQAIADRPSLVFASMNIGVIAAGSLVGLWLFNEKLSRLNKIGIFLAFAAIFIIFNS